MTFAIRKCTCYREGMDTTRIPIVIENSLQLPAGTPVREIIYDTQPAAPVVRANFEYRNYLGVWTPATTLNTILLE
jgi:hypothetical protein